MNVPPIAYNKARIRVQIEGWPVSVDLIDLEVPAIVVIDPGHGGTGGKNGGSNPNDATAKPSNILEKTMTLDFGLLLRDRLRALRTRDHLNLRLHMTRTEDVNPSLADRAHRARDEGADVLISLHFNDTDGSGAARGTETYYDSTGNYNLDEDQALAGRVNAAAFGAVATYDAGALNREVKGQGLDALSDDSLGNNNDYHPTRAVLLETEFIDVPAVDQLLNTGPNHQQVRQAIINSVADALQDDLLHDP
ncbi:MAG TPA: N-acetylmuramoyl-L-alanine amidase [Chthoniobacterales bacterium]|nr:N-acetylmuramoyl-L-alanine amidase [Chthoniobacterales bacterium]